MSELEKFAEILEKIARETNLRESAAVLSQSQDFIESNREKLMRQYPDQWIAVKKQEVIRADEDLLKLVRMLRASGAPLEHIALEMVSREEIPLAL